jgi:ribonucleoside-triphosphate reductase
MLSNVFLDVRRGGQGKENGKVPVLFPKLIFLYDSELHGEGKELEDLFDNAVETSKQCMYPDFLSLDKGYVADIYHKYGKIISPMGRRKPIAHPSEPRYSVGVA